MLQGPAYLLRTPRLELACTDPRDTQELHEVVRAEHARLAEHLPWAREEPLAFDVRLQVVRSMRARFDQSLDYVWTIREGARFVGMAGLHAGTGPAARAVGYWLRADACGRGLATEAVCAVLTAAFEVEGATVAEIHTAPANVRSVRLAARLGFVREGQLAGGREELPDLELHTLHKSVGIAALRRVTTVVAFDVLQRKLVDTALLRSSALSAR